jgi:hypothetical protein
MHITTGSTNADDFMPTRQGLYCGFANGTGGTHDNYLHHYVLTEACKGNLFFSDFNSGLWAVKLQPKRPIS